MKDKQLEELIFLKQKYGNILQFIENQQKSIKEQEEQIQQLEEESAKLKDQIELTVKETKEQKRQIFLL